MLKKYYGYPEIVPSQKQLIEIKKMKNEGNPLTKKEIDEKYPPSERSFTLNGKETFNVKFKTKKRDEYIESPTLIVNDKKDLEILNGLYITGRSGRCVVDEVEVKNKTYNNILMVSDNSKVEDLAEMYEEIAKSPEEKYAEKVAINKVKQDKYESNIKFHIGEIPFLEVLEKEELLEWMKYPEDLTTDHLSQGSDAMIFALGMLKSEVQVDNKEIHFNEEVQSAIDDKKINNNIPFNLVDDKEYCKENTFFMTAYNEKKARDKEALTQSDKTYLNSSNENISDITNVGIDKNNIDTINEEISKRLLENPIGIVEIVSKGQTIRFDLEMENGIEHKEFQKTLLNKVESINQTDVSKEISKDGDINFQKSNNSKVKLLNTENNVDNVTKEQGRRI